MGWQILRRNQVLWVLVVLLIVLMTFIPNVSALLHHDMADSPATTCGHHLDWYGEIVITNDNYCSAMLPLSEMNIPLSRQDVLPTKLLCTSIFHPPQSGMSLPDVQIRLKTVTL